MPAASQTFWKLRVPASVPFLFASMKVAIAASLVGAIVGELPTGAVAGIGAKLLTGSYYSQTIDMWAALVAGSVVAALLVTLVGVVGRLVDRQHGGAAGMSALCSLSLAGRAPAQGFALAVADCRRRASAEPPVDAASPAMGWARRC